MASFGERVKELRQKKSLTQAELAEALSAIGEDLITRSAVGMWETGKRVPKFEVLETLADYFNVGLDYLSGKEDAVPGLVVEPSEKWVEADMRLLKWFRSLPPEKQRAILIAQDAPEDLL